MDVVIAKKKRNKINNESYRDTSDKTLPPYLVCRGTSDATASSSLIVPLIMMPFDDFNPHKRPYSSFENDTGQTDGRTDVL